MNRLKMLNKFYRHKWYVMVAMIIIFTGCKTLTASQPVDKTQITKDFILRDGIPNFYNKIKTGKSANVAYLGGSITEAGEGWRSMTFSWLQNKFPSVAFHEINAAIGGTGSDFGAFRVKEHVLKYNPDLVFIEFAVNDRNNKYEEVIKSIEGIVRQIKAYRKDADIIFIYTIAKDMLPLYRKGELPVSVKAMEAVATHYGIPSVNLAYYVINKLDAGQLLFDPSDKDTHLPVFSRDGVHPNHNGHELYVQVIEQALSQMFKKGTPNLLKNPPAMMADNMEHVKMISPDKTNVNLLGEWDFKDNFDGAFKSYMPIILSTSDTTAKLEVKFTGPTFGLVDVLGPTSSAVKIIIDGKEYKKIRFDQWSTYNRINYFIMDDLGPGLHKAVVSLDPSYIKKSDIIKDANFKHFDDHVLYVGYILLRE